jgi:hypothetical protein
MFCDEKCMSEGHKKFHAIECSVVDAAYLNNCKDNASDKFDPFEMLRALTESLVRFYTFHIHAVTSTSLSSLRSSHNQLTATHSSTNQC